MTVMFHTFLAKIMKTKKTMCPMWASDHTALYEHSRVYALHVAAGRSAVPKRLPVSR